MKKIITLLAIGFTFTSCDKDDVDPTPKPQTCNCVKQTWIRQINPTLTQWNFNGATEFYSNNCTDDGKIINGHSGQGLEFQYRVKCN